VFRNVHALPAFGTKARTAGFAIVQFSDIVRAKCEISLQWWVAGVGPGGPRSNPSSVHGVFLTTERQNPYMKFTRIVAMTSLVVAAAVVGASTVSAAPAPVPAPQEIRYEVELVDRAVVTTLDGGLFKVADDKRTVDITDGAGKAVMRLPLSVNLNSVSHPLDATVEGDGTVLKVTPDMAPAKARPIFVRPVASPAEDQKALSLFSSYFGVGTAIGTFLGTAAGAALGCVLTLPVGCVPGVAVGASLGAIVGTVVVGGPVLLYSAIDLVSTLTAPPGTTKYSATVPPKAPPAPAPAR
jgi:hypothetical protein